MTPDPADAVDPADPADPVDAVDGVEGADGVVRQVAVVVPVDEAELVGDLLWTNGVLGIEEFAGTNAATGEASTSVCLVATPADGDVDRLVTLLDRWVVKVIELDGATYAGFLDAWREFADPVFAGERVVLWPAWWPIPDPDPSGEQLLVVLEPGRVFGSGGHPTTVLAVRALEATVRPGSAVLDVGCGSGVLSVAAALLGASRVTALDVDPDAVEVTLANAARNAVHHLVDAIVGSVDALDPLGAVGSADDPGGRADVVVANITAGVLIDLAPALVARCTPSGRLVLTGILPERRAEVADAYAGLGWEVHTEQVQDGWVLLVLGTGA